MKKVIFITIIILVFFILIKNKEPIGTSFNKDSLITHNKKEGLLKDDNIKTISPSSYKEKMKKEEIKKKVSSYFKYTQDINKIEIRKNIFDELYKENDEHTILIDLFTDFDKLATEYADDQAKIRVFAIDYLTYLATAYKDYNAIEDVILSVQKECERFGDRKSRSVDLEDLIIGIVEAKVKNGLVAEQEFDDLILKFRPSIASYKGYSLAAIYLFPDKRLDKKWGNSFYKNFKS